MPAITFIEFDGTEKRVDAKLGNSVMQTALDHSIDGILADCGGSCACATCHAYIDPAWLDRVPPAEEGEKSMIEFALHTRPESRLTCQITVTEALDGLIVRLPESQG